jgi:O-antigen biosynthesis protein WbqP
MAYAEPYKSYDQVSMKRIFDLSLVFISVIILFIPILLIALAVRLSSNGPVLYWSDRVGRNNKIFSMPKFRSMRTDTPDVASHLLQEPDAWLTPIGNFLRKSSLDELPQIWSVLKEEMSFVGPRPALYNQADLIALREEAGIDKLLPGITGWAQINGRDELNIEEKVLFDKEYLYKKSIFFDLKIILITIIRIIKSDGIRH